MKMLLTQRQRRTVLFAALLLPAPVIAALAPSDFIGASRAVPRPTMGAFEASQSGTTVPPAPTGLAIIVQRVTT
jgi:hypothetical protein